MSQATTQLVDPIVGYSDTGEPACDLSTLTASLLPQTPGLWDLNFDLDNTDASVPPADDLTHMPTAQDLSKPFPAPEVQHSAWQIPPSTDPTTYPEPKEQFELPSTPPLDPVLSILDSNINPSDLIPQPSETPPSPPSTTNEPLPPPSSPAAVPGPRKRGRKRKVLTPDAAEKRRKGFLQRNRMAARRCRDRKRVWISELEEKWRGLQSANLTLLEEKEGLVTEVTGLKRLLRRCSACECGAGREVGGSGRGFNVDADFDIETPGTGIGTGTKECDDGESRRYSFGSVSISEFSSVFSGTEDGGSSVGGSPFLIHAEK